MSPFRDLWRTPAALGALASCTLAGGLRSAGLPMVTWAVQSRPEASLLVLGALGYIALMALSYRAETRSAAAVDRVLGSRIHDFRMSLLDALRRADLPVVERERSAIADMERDFVDLAAVTNPLQGMTRSAVEFTGYLVFAIVIAGPAALVLALGLLGLAWQMKAITIRRRPILHAIAQGRRVLTQALGELWSGMPRFILSRAAMADAAGDVLRRRSQLGRHLNDDDHNVIESTVHYSTRPIVLCALLAVLATETLALGPEAAFGFVAMVFMTRGPTFVLLQWEPLLRADQASARLVALMRTLRDAQVELADDAQPRFERLELERVAFTFEGGFRLGPIDLSIERGELVFVIGHNGSGKTTLMKVMSGLYPAREGRVRVDGRVIARRRLRSLFTVAFIDAHLFRRAYGLDSTDEEIAAALATVGLDDVVGVSDGWFGTLDLSSGQRRRLALAVALLERRPIIVLDEWDAHQDPETKRFYFETLLPRFAAQGRTVVAVCHDERFFGAADRVIELSAGRLVPPREPDRRAAPSPRP